MGFTGSYVVCRCPQGIAEFEAITEYDDGCEWSTAYDDGWQVGQWPGEQIALGGRALITELAEATGRPAIMGYVYDSSCVFLDAATDLTTVWRACLARDVARAVISEEDLSWLGFRQGESLDAAGLLDARAATVAAVWFADRAGTTPSVEALDALFTTTRPSGPADEMFFELLTALGIRPAADDRM
jgi:hypothetical protein